MMPPLWWNWPLGTHGRAVVARKLGLPADVPDRTLEAAVRGFQRLRGIPVHGEVDIVTAKALGEEAGLSSAEYQGLTREDVLLRYELDEAALRRFEGQHGIRPGAGDPAELAMRLDRAR